ncbi:unnamed protein product [Closterium sp. NIES-54]
MASGQLKPVEWSAGSAQGGTPGSPPRPMQGWRVAVGRRMRKRRVRARRMRRMRGAGMTVRLGGIPRRMAVGKEGMMSRTMRWMGWSQRRWRRGWERVVGGRRQRRPHSMWLMEEGVWGLRWGESGRPLRGQSGGRGRTS